MDKELKTKWVSALRSGEYKQGMDTLRDKDDNFCCLGVLCDLIDKTAWRPLSTCYRYIDSSGTLSLQTRKSAGLHQGTLEQLVSMNDYKKLPFSEIADWIEVNL
jgi:hypothetical protein